MLHPLAQIGYTFYLSIMIVKFIETSVTLVLFISSYVRQRERVRVRVRER